jgi:CheY-like chemotaxis protein
VAASANPNGRLILVVDDDPSVIRTVSAALAMAGFRAMVAEHGGAGLEAFLLHDKDIDLVLSDVLMPVMDGITMIQEIRKRRSDIPVLLMTAYSDAVITTINHAKFPLIRKPFLPEDLVRVVKANLNPPHATA